MILSFCHEQYPTLPNFEHERSDWCYHILFLFMIELLIRCAALCNAILVAAYSKRYDSRIYPLTRHVTGHRRPKPPQSCIQGSPKARPPHNIWPKPVTFQWRTGATICKTTTGQRLVFGKKVLQDHTRTMFRKGSGYHLVTLRFSPSRSNEVAQRGAKGKCRALGRP